MLSTKPTTKIGAAVAEEADAEKLAA